MKLSSILLLGSAAVAKGQAQQTVVEQLLCLNAEGDAPVPQADFSDETFDALLSTFQVSYTDAIGALAASPCPENGIEYLENGDYTFGFTFSAEEAALCLASPAEVARRVLLANGTTAAAITTDDDDATTDDGDDDVTTDSGTTDATDADETTEGDDDETTTTEEDDDETTADDAAETSMAPIMGTTAEPIHFGDEYTLEQLLALVDCFCDNSAVLTTGICTSAGATTVQDTTAGGNGQVTTAGGNNGQDTTNGGNNGQDTTTGNDNGQDTTTGNDNGQDTTTAAATTTDIIGSSSLVLQGCMVAVAAAAVMQ